MDQNYLLLFQAALLILFYKSYSLRDEVLWGMTCVLAGIMTFILYYTGNPAIAVLNAGIFMISIVYFFIDIFANYSSELSALLAFKKKEK